MTMAASVEVVGSVSSGSASSAGGDGDAAVSSQGHSLATAVNSAAAGEGNSALALLPIVAILGGVAVGLASVALGVVLLVRKLQFSFLIP